ncbi:hypothetical protein HRI_002643300 [Hibiscus trionum]|uniref:DUF3741 domain-containing protein n=1 Tax=Hibiscus trionum TaxID=183268 RepID=A0A9W7I900_HIBTR|nr:hypothetical protein HRI_002643300 [Hibiscus trionum]
MAKTSDFALKLLDDLRLRKERMAVSRDSKATNPMVADACSYSKTAYRSSREQKTLINTGSKAGSTRSSPSGGRKSVTTTPVSNQIVPFGRHQKSKKIGDRSSAVAFALENGGKGGRTEFSVNSSMFNFLHNIGRKQMDNGKIGRRNSNLPTVSHLDIEAISRGVQNLNQILIACSNGLNFDRYSIEIGRELLKGAMDLDKSLRMLANLQEPSEYSTPKPRGSRIMLLDEDEDDDDDERQLDISSFSLGRPLRNYNDIQDVARSDLMLRLKDLTYSSKVTTNSKHGKKVPAASSSHSHKQSIGYGPEIRTLTAFSEQNQSSSLQCKQEKLRVPNVIAKLMGLDELPRNVDSKVTAKESGKQPGKVLTNTYGSIRVAAHDKLPRQKDSEDIKPMMSSRKATIKTDKQQSDIVRSSHNYASRKEIKEKERKHDNVKHREQKIAERSVIKEPVFEDDMQQMIQYVHKRSEVALTLQEKTKYGENKLHGFEQVSVLQKSELEKRRRNSEERKQQSTKQKLQSKQKKNEPNCGNFSKPMSVATATNLQKKEPQMNQAATSRKGSTKHIDATHDDKHHKNQADDRSSKNLNIKIQSSLNKNSRHSRGYQESESAKACIRFTVDEKPVQVQPTMKARIEKGSNLKVPRINEVMTEKGASVYNLLSTDLQERKQVRLEQLAVSRKSDQTKASRLKEVEPKIIRSNKSISSIPQERRKEAKQESVLSSLREDECEKLNKIQALVRKDSGQTSVPKVTNEQQDQEPDFGRAKESQFKNSASDPLHRTNEANVYDKPLNQRTYTSEMPEPLTESEDHFKQILMKSQLFMHTAKALFKVSIPISILPGDGDDYHEQESKLVLDCGYEVMKRKGRRQELNAHPFLKASTAASNKAKSMDDMVKQICKDFDKLKLYGRDGKEDSSFEDYLPKMVEADVNDKEPDLNCMWDLGWNSMMFACLEKDDVIRDVERYVLNELLVDVTKDLLTAVSVTT